MQVHRLLLGADIRLYHRAETERERETCWYHAWENQSQVVRAVYVYAHKSNSCEKVCVPSITCFWGMLQNGTVLSKVLAVVGGLDPCWLLNTAWGHWVPAGPDQNHTWDPSNNLPVGVNRNPFL